jgi:sulfatase maturation enzyme AslB (radical SAM superfamily)
MKKFKRVNIEISNICNLQCSFCPEVHREKKIMKEELFRGIISQVAPLTEEVCLHLMGEPMGHPKLSELVDICAEFGTPINLTTNGTLLDERRKAILLRPIVRQVNFSVHSFEANFGEKDVMPYLTKVFAFTRQAFAERPDLYINYRIWDLKDPVSLTPTNARIRGAIEEEFGFVLDPAVVDLRRRKGYKVRERLYLNLDSRFVWPSPQAPFRSEKGFCHGLSNHFGIHADGTVVPCCLDKEAVLNLGTCETRPITEILAGERATKIAEGFAKNLCVEDLCQKCDFIKRFDARV